MNDDELRGFYMNHDALQGGDLNEYFVERFIDKGRHVETQCGRDSHGNFTVYSTRDCSVQRRNQKLVEEAPAPFLPSDVTDQLGNLLPPTVRSGRLRRPWHLRIHGDRARQSVLPGSQSAPAGGAHRHRGGQRPRPGARAARPSPAGGELTREPPELRGHGLEPRHHQRGPGHQP